jgi:hypothetical protein
MLSGGRLIEDRRIFSKSNGQEEMDEIRNGTDLYVMLLLSETATAN